MQPLTFDYVIVGAGAAGCVLANRLSADPAVTVCLIEAGPEDRNPLIPVPLASMILAQNGLLNWGYHTTPEAATAGRRVPFARGKVVGGTTSINGMVYMRGHPSDYDDWAQAGNTGWSYDDVLPYFKRSENNAAWPASPYHGASGPMHVSDPTHVSALAEAFVQGMVETGAPRCPDFNGESQEGAGFRQLFQHRGRRVSAASAFLTPVRGRHNLHVRPGALADRLVVEDGRCIGVEILQGGEPLRIGARREVIVSAGTLNSPALLLRSGIGDGASLQALGIETLRHLPEVGRNYQDHVNVFVRNDNPAGTSYGVSLKTLAGLAWSPFEWAIFRRGLVASNLAYASAFLRTDPSLMRPNLQLIFWPVHRPPGRLVGWGHSFCVMAHVLRPLSRGQVTLAHKDPRVQPVIRTGLLTAQPDVDLLTRGIRMARDLFRSAAFASHAGAELEPGPDVESDAALASYIRRTAVQGLHCAGTCRMGADDGAVVRPDLRVSGLDGLRVADASIMPTLIGGNTAAPTIMIGEKASDLVLGNG
jgi:choline dehydrogenase-like flavoprotein